VVSALQTSRVRTERAAEVYLKRIDSRVIRPTGKEKAAIVEAWNICGKQIIASGFDLLKLPPDVTATLFFDELRQKPQLIQETFLLEAKGTTTKVGVDFSGMFFALAESEKKNAEELPEHYFFAFVQTDEACHLISKASEVFSRITLRYAKWSVTLR